MRVINGSSAAKICFLRIALSIQRRIFSRVEKYRALINAGRLLSGLPTHSYGLPEYGGFFCPVSNTNVQCISAFTKNF